MSLAKNIVMIVIILLLLALGIHQQLRINELDETISTLEKQNETLKYENDKKQNELDTPLEDRMEKKAGNLGYKDPNAQYYYNDFSG